MRSDAKTIFLTVTFGTSVHHLVTVLGVEPGDDVVVGEAEDEGPAGRSLGRPSLSVRRAVLWGPSPASSPARRAAA